MNQQTVRNLVVAVAVAGTLVASPTMAQTIFTGPAAGTWGTVANWSLGLPTSTTDAQINNNATAVDVQINALAAVRNLTIDAGDGASVNNGQRLSLFGNVLNNGLLKINAVNANTYLQPTGTINFGGTGAVELADTTTGLNGFFYDNTDANAAADHIINGPNHTIRGRGFVGNAGTTQITNNGLIDSNVAASNLTLTPNSSNLSNAGLLRASNGGSLILDGSGGGAFINTTGSVEAQGPTSIVSPTALARIKNGSLNGTGTFIIPASQRAFYDTLTNASTTNVANAGRLDLIGTIVNDGVIRVDATTSFTYLQPSGTVNLNGTGEVVLADTSTSVNGYFYDNNNTNAAADHIINGANHTIRGRGFVGFAGTTQITNNGEIVADVAASRLTLTPNASGLLNTGVLRATGGGELELDGNAGSIFTNTASLIEADTNSTVLASSLARIVGGTLAGAGTFVIPANDRAVYNGVLHNAALTSVTNAGRLDLVGTIVNNGVIRVDATSSFTYLQPSGILDLSGNGAVELADSSTSANGYFYDNNDTNAAADHIVNGANHTIRGIGFVGFGATTQITNNGTITANFPSGALTLLPNALGMTNNGTLRATATGILALGEGVATATYSGSGPIVVDSGSTILVNAGVAGTLGPVTGTGTVSSNGAGITLGFQSIRAGAINATSNGIVKITAGGGNTGTSVVNTITLASNGRLDLTDNGLIVEYTGGSPAASIRTLLAAGRAAGAWNGINGIGSSLANANGRAVGYAEASSLGSPATFLGQPVDATSILIRYTVDGDTNLDGATNFSDLLSLAANYNGTSKVWFQGDFNYDGSVSFSDLLILAATYNQSLTGDLSNSPTGTFAGDWALAQAIVPEPATLTLLLASTAVLSRRRR
jgi:hypothetical protein